MWLNLETGRIVLALWSLSFYTMAPHWLWTSSPTSFCHRERQKPAMTPGDQQATLSHVFVLLGSGVSLQLSVEKFHRILSQTEPPCGHPWWIKAKLKPVMNTCSQTWAALLHENNQTHLSQADSLGFTLYSLAHLISTPIQMRFIQTSTLRCSLLPTGAQLWTKSCFAVG